MHSMILFTYAPRKGQTPIKLLDWNMISAGSRRSEQESENEASSIRILWEKRLWDSVALSVQATMELNVDVTFLQGSGVPVENVQNSAYYGSLGGGYTIIAKDELVTVVRGVAEPFDLLEGPDVDETPRRGKILAAYTSTLDCVLLNVDLEFDSMDTQDGRLKAEQTKDHIRAWVEAAHSLHPGAVIVIAGDTKRMPVLTLEEDNTATATIEELKQGLGYVRISAPGEPSCIRISQNSSLPILSWSDFALWIPSPTWEWPKASSKQLQHASGLQSTSKARNKTENSSKEKNGTPRAQIVIGFPSALYLLDLCIAS